jgi:hypothetical protein
MARPRSALAALLGAGVARWVLSVRRERAAAADRVRFLVELDCERVRGDGTQTRPGCMRQPRLSVEHPYSGARAGVGAVGQREPPVQRLFPTRGDNKGVHDPAGCAVRAPRRGQDCACFLCRGGVCGGVGSVLVTDGTGLPARETKAAAPRTETRSTRSCSSIKGHLKGDGTAVVDVAEGGSEKPEGRDWCTEPFGQPGRTRVWPLSLPRSRPSTPWPVRRARAAWTPMRSALCLRRPASARRPSDGRQA